MNEQSLRYTLEHVLRDLQLLCDLISNVLEKYEKHEQVIVDLTKEDEEDIAELEDLTKEEIIIDTTNEEDLTKEEIQADITLPLVFKMPNGTPYFLDLETPEEEVQKEFIETKKVSPSKVPKTIVDAIGKLPVGWKLYRHPDKMVYYVVIDDDGEIFRYETYVKRQGGQYD